MSHAVAAHPSLEQFHVGHDADGDAILRQSFQEGDGTRLVIQVIDHYIRVDEIRQLRRGPTGGVLAALGPDIGKQLLAVNTRERARALLQRLADAAWVVACPNFVLGGFLKLNTIKLAGSLDEDRVPVAFVGVKDAPGVEHELVELNPSWLCRDEIYLLPCAIGTIIPRRLPVPNLLRPSSDPQSLITAAPTRGCSSG